MILRKELLTYLPEDQQISDLDPFPSLGTALKWGQNFNQNNPTARLPAASELFLANAVMGAQRSVLEHYSIFSSVDLSRLFERPIGEPEFLCEAIAEDAALQNQAFSRILPMMRSEFGSPNTATELREKAALLPNAFESKLSIMSFIETPAELYPESLDQQAGYILQRWQPWLGKWAARLFRGLDYYAEEHQSRFSGPGPVRTLEYAGHWTETDQRFSPDQHWMPGVVMIAKNTLVWLDQLSKRHGREITRLDQIPDEELNTLADCGFNALWLIGLWQRSDASRTIKRWCGNADAAASAYSIKRYRIADALGGEAALESLRNRCITRGIRLASDMVPNHTSLDSDWMIDHPEWFISRSDCPFPSYRFSGESLLGDPSTGIYLEDHYFNQSDAAVVFKRTDFEAGETRYIYHGNDGTSMPWNDTAQLNYLNPELREAVIQTILNVARQFPIIRFDAAMTLTKKHFQRLWFPIPGTESGVSSRADSGMTKEKFDELMGEEFWREVVDRIAREIPDTLLLAEAFWLMEGYFVRSLGMHRVYNSAFMNMLKMEENAAYRLSIKRTLEFDPEILKRFVNFMNNPDEEPAVIQFGDGDKYFGVATMLVTMPGLPLWGHGQTEGFHEKYGMEYIRSYWDEIPNQDFIDRHQREIFPLIKKRYLFAESVNYRLYDFHTAEGNCNENVMAYSNSINEEFALILVNNAYQFTKGKILISCPFMDASTAEIRVESFSDAFRLNERLDDYLIFREQRSGLEYLRRIRDISENGFYTELNGYEARVYMNFAILPASDQLQDLCDDLEGRGVSSVSAELMVLPFRGIHQSLELVLNTLPDRNPTELKRILEIFYSAVHKNPDMQLQLPDFDLVFGNLNRLICNTTLDSLSNRPEWITHESETITSILLFVQAIGPAVWLRLYDEGKLDILVKTSTGLSAGRWETFIDHLLNPPNSIFKFILDNQNNLSIRQLLGCNDWAGKRFIRREPFEEFLSVCYLLGMANTRICHRILGDTDYLFDDFIRKIQEAQPNTQPFLNEE